MRATVSDNNFDGMRLIASLMVMYSHAFAIHGVGEPNIFNFSSVGGFGVYIFFVMSGYLVAASYQRDPSVARFLVRRSLRIFPALIVVTLVSAIIIGPFTTYIPAKFYFTHEQFYAFFSNCVLYVRYALPGSFETNPLPSSVNGSLWSLPIEFMMYLILLLVGMAGLMRVRWMVPLLVVVTGLIAHYVRMNQPGMVAIGNIDLRYVLFLGPYFFAGVAIHLYRDVIRFTPPLLMLIVAAGLALNGNHYIHLWGIVAVPCIVMAICLSPTKWMAVPKWLGDISYGVYLYSFPIQQTVEYFSKGRLSLVQAISVGAVCTILCAMASWRLVEAPALSLKPRQPRRRAEPDIGGEPEIGVVVQPHPKQPAIAG